MAAYRQAWATLVHAVPALADLPVGDPWTKLDEASMASWRDAWTSGVRAGAAYENLRQAVLAPSRVCGTCDGFGLVRGGSPDETPASSRRARPVVGLGPSPRWRLSSPNRLQHGHAKGDRNRLVRTIASVRYNRYHSCQPPLRHSPQGHGPPPPCEGGGGLF